MRKLGHQYTEAEEAQQAKVKAEAISKLNDKLEKLELKRVKAKIEEDWEEHDAIIADIITLKKQNGMFTEATPEQQIAWNVSKNGEPLNVRKNSIFKLSKETKKQINDAQKSLGNPFFVGPILLFLFSVIIVLIRKNKRLSKENK